MPRKVYIERNRLSSLISESTEEGTYKIGMEPGAPVGGEYYHVVDDDTVNEASNVYANGDLSYMDYIEYIPHDNPMEEDIDEPYYEVEAFDNDGNRIFYGDLTFDELYDYFDENVIHMITNRGGRKVSQVAYRIDDLLSYNTKVNDINNVEEVNAIAKKIQTNYGQSSFILTDGDVVSFADHSNIATIDGMTIAKFVSLGNIRVGAGGSIEVAKMPTREQFRELKLFVRNNDGNVYLDISEDTGQFYSHVICSATYKNAKPDRVVNDIYYYFEEGVKPQGGMYESKMVKENIEDEVESSEVDLSSFEKRDSLPSIWKDDDTLDSKVRLKLLDIADDFWEYVDITWVEPVGIIITGSLCNYNWSEFSDVDLHLIVNFNEIDERVDFVRQYLDSKKNEWNEEHGALKIYGYPVELYVQNIDEDVNAGGVYDLEENKWIRKPSYDDMEEIGTESDDIKEKAARVMTIIDDMWDYFNETDDSHKLEVLGDDADNLWQKIKKMRTDGLTEDGEMSVGNIVYKYMRRRKYLDKLFDLRAAIYDRTNSITESNNKRGLLREYLEKEHNMPLYEYFKFMSTASDQEKIKDLIFEEPYSIEKYLKTIGKQHQELNSFIMEMIKDSDVVYEEDFVNGVSDTIVKLGLSDGFISFFKYTIDYYEWPSWLVMDFIKVVKNEWCIHFTSDSDNISKYGFTGGTDDVSHLGYTGAGQEKKSAGYNFAFLINDRSVNFNSYGDEAVIFRASGVEVYHSGDEQNQVIFWGPNVREIIPIHQEYGDWVVYGGNGQILVRKDKPSEIAIWAVENLPQYRKQIMTGKNGYIPRRNYWDSVSRKVVNEPFPLYKNESVSKDLVLLGESDGSVDLFTLAKERFGTTYDIRECGYILPDGSMLDFSGRSLMDKGSDSSHLRGERHIDHREIYTIGWSEDGETKNFDIEMNEFIRLGAIRTHVSSSYALFNFFKKPTKKQIDIMMRIIRYAGGCVDVEIGDGYESITSGEYDNTNPRRIMSEIIRYFDEGIKLMGNISESVSEHTSYDKFREGQAFRYRIIASMVKDGYLFHGTDCEWDEFDKNRIKGEERAVYGYGAYFTNAAYKCEEYGNHFVVLDSEDFEFLNIKEKVHPEYNIFKEKMMNYYKIQNALDNARNNREYYYYSNMLDEYNSSINHRTKELLERFITIIEKVGIVDYNELNKRVDYSFTLGEDRNIPKEISELYLALGYDGFVCGNQFVIFNFKKLNENLVKDKNALIARYAEEQLSEVKEYIKVLKDFQLNEETVADGNSEHNPYAKRWKAERDALKNFLSNFGQIMTSRENGKQYKVFQDQAISNLIGYNYCICIQWDPIKMEVGSTPYIRALDKFTRRIFQAQFDTRGHDNELGTSDDIGNLYQPIRIRR